MITSLINRYLVLKRRGFKGVVWCDSGRFYISPDEYFPDFNNRLYVTEMELDAYLTEAESRLARKSPDTETSPVRQDRRSETLSAVCA